MIEKSKKTILLVEDEAIIAVAQKVTLEKYGYNIITANSGEMAVEVFKDNSAIDLVLMDIDLGEGIDGTEAAGVMLGFRDVPLVFLSSHTEPAVVEKTENITSYGYVVKNSGITVLDASIKMAFKLYYAHYNIQAQKAEMEALYEEMEASNEELEALNEELVRTGKEIMESEERFKALHNASFGGITIHDKGIILECNQGLSDITGYSYDELIGMNGLLLISEKTRQMVMDNISAGYEKPYEALGVRKNGEEYPLRLEARNVPYKGKMVRTVEFRDITEIKLAEESLIERQNQLAILSDNLPGGFVYQVNTGKDGTDRKFTYISSGIERLHGVTADEVMKDPMALYRQFVEEDRVKLAEHEAEAILNMSRFVDQARIRKPSGEIIWVYITSAPRRLADNTLVWDGIEIDITDRKLAEDEIKTKNDQLKIAMEEMEAANEELTAAMEELDAANEELIATTEDLQTKELALRESEKKFKAIIDTIPVAIHLTTGVEQVTQYVNPTMVKLFGYTMEDIPSVAEWWPLAYPDEDYRRRISEEWNDRVIHAIETQTPIEPMEVVVNCKDGSKKNISWGYITLGDKNYSCGLDLTDRIKAEEEIKLDEARLESLLSINQHSTDNIQDLLDYTLAEAIKLTESKIGYIYFYDEDREEFALNTWSKEVMAQCAVVEKKTIYQLSKTGLWGEAVRQRRPIMVNDFEASNIYKKGLPDGHNPLKRYLTIPVISNERIVAVVGVANKETDYNESDIRQLNLMMDAVWKIVQRKQSEDEVLNLLSEKELLLKEVHHRIKNNMSTISNLLRIQGEDQDNPEIKKLLFDAEGRVLSMMVLYDKLYRSADFEKMSIADYLPALVDEILANFPERMSVTIEKQIDDFILDVKILQSLGVIINELLTNIMKYAFSGRSNCKITISQTLPEIMFPLLFRIMVKDCLNLLIMKSLQVSACSL
ncbi:MAG: hypothetical protein CVV49_19935 [Spirochaetae bacterium HGW-Spirochaetae-5]|nr:MAG: hypothetical protein CVV49_19935 [Spirochaetae bacterium HGW-Spirochaetae-5]